MGSMQATQAVYQLHIYSQNSRFLVSISHFLSFDAAEQSLFNMTSHILHFTMHSYMENYKRKHHGNHKNSQAMLSNRIKIIH